MIFLIATCIKAKVIQQPLLIKFEHQPWEKLVTDLSTTICDDVPTSSVLLQSISSCLSQQKTAISSHAKYKI